MIGIRIVVICSVTGVLYVMPFVIYRASVCRLYACDE